MNQNVWLALSAALVQALNSKLHNEGRIDKQALLQLLTSALAGFLPNWSGLGDVAGRELMVGVIRGLLTLPLGENHVLAHALNAIMSDLVGVLLYNTLAPLQIMMPVIPPSVVSPLTNTTGTNVPASNGNVPLPRVNSAPQPQPTPNPWAG